MEKSQIILIKEGKRKKKKKLRKLRKQCNQWNRVKNCERWSINFIQSRSYVRILSNKILNPTIKGTINYSHLIT